MAVDDVLAFGGRVWRLGSRPGVIAIAAAVVLAAGVLIGVPVARHHDRAAGGQPSASPSVGVQPSAGARPTNTSRLRTTLHGAPVTVATGVQLLITQHLGWPLSWFTLGTGKRSPLELPPDAQRYGVQSIPTMILFKDGEPAAAAIGAQPKPALARALGLAAESE